ncbi:TIGR02281 family clan AA aspartic protease [Aliiglaciecola sp. M165]|uniref:retropepsin-like aspartic protease family protein n=1 Tax=Aliiglaciecola sp. M165 TaxID=2593649 RepID=UPI00117D7512|nr:retropepsin-like aspartic protease [Aliiglaciecola sp. M165]TRY29415.1 hypothetical protein FM019_18645 [Aliiglaciecola sp. M165]
MKGLVTLLIIALMGSLFLNWQLWNKLKSEQSYQSTTQTESVKGEPNHNALASGNRTAVNQQTEAEQVAELAGHQSSPQMRQKAQAIYAIRQQLAAGETQKARDAILDYLRANPRDIDYLLLEADLVKLTAQTSDVLQHFYGLLDLPLNTEQKAEVLLVITSLTINNIEKLKSIRSWDVLATFLEPLWQFDPNRRSIIVGLAEAYARQGQEFLMENVLASLPQDDLEVSKIRSMLANVNNASEITDIDENQRLDYERTLDLENFGDHFIAQAFIGRYSLNLMIDTGASTTVITDRTFQQLRRRSDFNYVGTYKINTAGGQVYAPIYQLQQLFIGGFRLDDLAVVVLPMPDFTQANGLLGMNLLRQFDFKIDQQNSQLLLNRLPR